MEIKFKETMNALCEYFAELKDLKTAGLDIIKLAPHKSLYNLYLRELIETYGLEVTDLMLQKAYEQQLSDKEIDSLWTFIFDETNVNAAEPETPVDNSTAKYYIDDKAVTKEEYEKALDEVEKRVFTSFSNDWLIKNIFG